MNHTAHVFFEVNMGKGHPGLTEMLSEYMKKKALKIGECAIFINRKWTACKILYVDGLLIHWRSPTGEALDLEAIKTLPNQVAGDIHLSREILSSSRREFENRQRRGVAAETRAG